MTSLLQDFILGHSRVRPFDGQIFLQDAEGLLQSVRNTYTILEKYILEDISRYIAGIAKARPSDCPKVGDLVLFVSQSNLRTRIWIWKRGFIEETSVYGKSQIVKIKYKNITESVFRICLRHVTQIVLILSIQEIKSESLLNSRKHKYNWKF